MFAALKLLCAMEVSRG